MLTSETGFSIIPVAAHHVISEVWSSGVDCREARRRVLYWWIILYKVTVTAGSSSVRCALVALEGVVTSTGGCFKLVGEDLREDHGRVCTVIPPSPQPNRPYTFRPASGYYHQVCNSAV